MQKRIIAKQISWFFYIKSFYTQKNKINNNLYDYISIDMIKIYYLIIHYHLFL